MTARNKLLTQPPGPVTESLKRLGADLRTARLRRNLTIEEIAIRIGTGHRAVADAERGKASTSAAGYTPMRWTLDLLDHLGEVARPDRDSEGQSLTLARDRERARARPAGDSAP